MNAELAVVLGLAVSACIGICRKWVMTKVMDKDGLEQIAFTNGKKVKRLKKVDQAVLWQDDIDQTAQYLAEKSGIGWHAHLFRPESRDDSWLKDE